MLLSLPRWNTRGLLAVAAGLALIALWLVRRRARQTALWVAWAPAHLAVVVTGGLNSPLLPVAALWAVLRPPGDNRTQRRSGVLTGTALLLFVLIAGAAWLRGGASPDSLALLRLGVILVLGAAVAAWSGGLAIAPGEGLAPVPAELPAPEGEPVAPAAALAQALELARRAADAHEAALWQAGAGEREMEMAVWCAAPGTPAPTSPVRVDGHPFGWAVDEQVHVHLQRGRRALPSPWAREMLLVPFPGAPRVLAFAYPAAVSPGAEQAALDAGRHIALLLRLLADAAEAERGAIELRVLLDAVRTLPGVIELDPFARQLAELVCRAAGADGAAVALARPDEVGARLLHVESRAADGAVPVPAGVRIGETDSRLALTLKHGVPITSSDLRAEREQLPLLASGERWQSAPCSAALMPLQADGRVVGAVAVWHAAPGRFTERETALLDLLCSLAPLPLRSASRYAELDRRASTDAMTGLPNRRAFEARLAVASGAFERYHRRFSLVIVDVDHFKRFNDTWGHEAGDHVLRHVAELLQSSVRDVDLAARLGGEEFVILLPETELRAATDAAERLRRSVEARTVVWNGRPLSVTISAGVASCPECTATPGQLLALADAALYLAKGAGRNRVTAAPHTSGASAVAATVR